jgi:hypothetical protein
MKHQVKLCLKIGWLSAAVMILLMGTSMCAANDEACFQAGGAMFLLMFWLSFPSGLVFSLAALAFVDRESIHYPSDFISAWMVMAFGGLLQWFVIVPRLFEKRNLTTLNLSADSPSTSISSAHTPTKPAPEADVPTSLSSADISTQPAPETTICIPAPDLTVPEPPVPASPKAINVEHRKITRRKTIRTIAPFDKQGRTPLQRVIDGL